MIFLALILITCQFCTPTLNEAIKTFESFDDFENEIIIGKEKNKIYVINFWATWCKPCVAEMPYFEELQNKNNKSDLEVIFVSLDFGEDVKNKVEQFLDTKKFKSKCVILTDGASNEWIDKVDPSWSGAIPITLYLKNDKRLFVEKSYHSLKEIESDIKILQND